MVIVIDVFYLALHTALIFYNLLNGSDDILSVFFIDRNEGISCAASESSSSANMAVARTGMPVVGTRRTAETGCAGGGATIISNIIHDV